jgi:hypothetical protein
MMGKNESCKHCHVIDKEAKYKTSFDTFDASKYTSNFTGIERKHCASCHSEKQVTQECQVCHIYHLEAGFKKNMVADSNSRL